MNVQAKGFMENNPHFSSIDEGTGLVVDEELSAEKKDQRPSTEEWIAAGGHVEKIKRGVCGFKSPYAIRAAAKGGKSSTKKKHAFQVRNSAAVEEARNG